MCVYLFIIHTYNYLHYVRVLGPMYILYCNALVTLYYIYTLHYFSVLIIGFIYAIIGCRT